MKIFSKPIKFLKEVKQELAKVSWSSRQELLASTFVVISATFIMAIYIGVIDVALSHLLRLLFK